MSQPAIRSFFPAVSNDAYAAQLERLRNEHVRAVEEVHIQRANARARHQREREQGERRGPGRPRKTPAVRPINISHSSGFSINIAESGDVRIVHNRPTSPISIADDSVSERSSSSSSGGSGDSSGSSSGSSSSGDAIAFNSVPCSAAASTSSSSSSSSSSAALTESQSEVAVSTRRAWTDWVAQPQLFNIITAAVKKHAGSISRAVNELRASQQMAGAFALLRASTVTSWYVKGGRELTEAVKRRQQGQPVVRGRGRPSLLEEHRALEEYVIDAMINIRQGSGAVNSIVIASYFRGFIKAKNPDLLKQYSFSRRWCRKWFSSTFAWSWKKATTSGQKLPADWEEQRAAMAMRVAATAAKHKITDPGFIINWDQTGVVLLPASKYTYEHVKQRHTAMVGLEEKRQITAVVASTLGGEMLPLQLIFTGKDKDKANATGKQKGKVKDKRKGQRAVPSLSTADTDKTHGWHLTQTHNHWSNLESMKDYIRFIIRPWVDQKALARNERAPHCILLIDCWSVHKSKDFLQWMATAYPSYHIVFVPANCTSKAQPADVVLQRPFKNTITNAFNAWMTDEIHLQVKGGTPAQDVRVNTGMKKIKPHVVHWTWAAWNKLKKNQQLVKEGWGKCGMSLVLDAAFQRDALMSGVDSSAVLEGEEGDYEAEAQSDDEEEHEDGVEAEGPAMIVQTD